MCKALSYAEKKSDFFLIALASNVILNVNLVTSFLHKCKLRMAVHSFLPCSNLTSLSVHF